MSEAEKLSDKWRVQNEKIASLKMKITSLKNELRKLEEVHEETYIEMRNSCLLDVEAFEERRKAGN
jgi:hypothetical protein